MVYIYPRTGQSDKPPGPDWDRIPGARGCTPRSCSVRDHHAELQALRARVFGLSTQETDYQRDAVDRLQLPFPILSDSDLALTAVLNLPTFEYHGMTLLKRMTLFIRDGVIEWLQNHPETEWGIELISIT